MSAQIDADRVARLVGEANGPDIFPALRAVAELRSIVRRAETSAIGAAVDAGRSYAEIGRALGTTRQSVRIKYLARLSAGDTPTKAELLAQQIAEWEEQQRWAEADAAAFFERMRLRRDQEAT